MATDPRVRVTLVGVVVELVGWEPGHWCLDCHLGSGIRSWVAVRSSAGPMHLQQRLHCVDCGGRRVVLDEDVPLQVRGLELDDDTDGDA